jgi:hypothetical protein
MDLRQLDLRLRAVRSAAIGVRGSTAARSGCRGPIADRVVATFTAGAGRRERDGNRFGTRLW